MSSIMLRLVYSSPIQKVRQHFEPPTPIYAALPTEDPASRLEHQMENVMKEAVVVYLHYGIRRHYGEGHGQARE